MARFKKYTIQQGDTLQSIAARELGDANSWVDLFQYNDLQYPYIVDTAQEKHNNLEHLVMLGDQIVIPIETTIGDINPLDLMQEDKRQVENLVLGSDLNLTSFFDRYKDKGTQDDILELSGNYKDGDIAVTQGQQNVKQAIIMRLLTPLGSILLHPDYGSNLHNLFEKANSDLKVKIDAEISRCILTDSRVATVSRLDSYISGSMYRSMWEIKLQSFDETFKLLVANDEANDFVVQ